MLSTTLVAFLTQALLAAAVTARTLDVYPETFQLSSGFQEYNESSCITLTPSDTLATLDYGTEVGGFPFFHVQSKSGNVQVEAKYTEPKIGLAEPFSDGPWTFSNGLAGTFRVETFNVTKPGSVQSYFIQGGLRWQSLRLLTQGTLEICGVGIKSGNDRTPVKSLPGYFECSKKLYNDIWALGPRTVQQACIEAGTATSTWDVTADGVLLRGQQPAVSVLGGNFANYTMEFTTKIVRGGTGWKVAAEISGLGAYFVLTSEYPVASTFVNTNRTLVPANTLAAGYGWNLVNQTTLLTGKVDYFPVPFPVKEDEWYKVSTVVNATGYGVTINGTTIFVPVASLQIVTAPSGSLSEGTWGFGPYQDQVAYVKNVNVYSNNGTRLYHNAMTSESVLEEYGVMSNTHNLCLDGAKRDRLVWTGDFAHTQRVIAASTGRDDFVTGTLEYIMARQASSGSNAGWFSMAPAMGAAAKYTNTYDSFGLLDYQFLFLDAFADYYFKSGNNTFLEKYWGQIKEGVEVALPLVDKSSGLAVPVGGIFFMGASNGTAPSAALVYTLQKMAKIAGIMKDTTAASTWNSTALSISKAINLHLWNENLGTYASALTTPNETSIAGTAWAILAGVASETRAKSAIEALSSLRTGVGYKDSTSVASSSSTQISTFLSGFLLESLLRNSQSSSSPSNITRNAINVLLDQTWGSMITDAETYTGGSWEYVDAAGSPGLGLYTSLAHPWASSPTYVLSDYVLGVQPASVGYKQWTFRPAILDIDVTWARGRVSTPQGTITASWNLTQNDIVLRVCAPHGTSGLVSLPFVVDSYRLNGKAQAVPTHNFEASVAGGSCQKLSLTRM
ncbi:Six-hairpin glycosidase [Penicillium malachiteum]|uniref:Six-hairpin glycosidase n=1 Tax=Penicillium malachiteum TaxID=1324776 RepID=UPI002548C2B2|nr:Six-hairpin glycosidase [Penicillium malachiteum]KAJ5725279.1 Six-hairpin glycosidase [Penicillium malachiteum]